MVLTVHPSRSSTMIAASKDNGMLTKETSTVLRSRMNRYSTRPISTAPMIRSSLMPPSAASMKLAGRCSAGLMVTPWASSAGLSSAIAASTARVVSQVLAPYWLDMLISTPGVPMIRASPMSGAGASTTSATSPMRTIEPSVVGIWPRATSWALRAWPRGSTTILCCGVSI